MDSYLIEERLNRIFSSADSRSLCVACDHGLMLDPTLSWINIAEVVSSAVEENADALLLGAGQIRRFSKILSQPNAPSLIVRTDWVNLLRLDNGASLRKPVLPVQTIQYRSLIGAKEAFQEFGATACIAFLLEDPAGIYESITIQACSTLISECHQIGLPCIVEVIPVNLGSEPGEADHYIQRGCWLAADMGADAVKIPYTGNQEKFSSLIREIDIKTFVLGGSNIADENLFLDLMDQVLQRGADGLIIGRNVSNSKDPKGMIRRLHQLVRGKSA